MVYVFDFSKLIYTRKRNGFYTIANACNMIFYNDAKNKIQMHNFALFELKQNS